MPSGWRRGEELADVVLLRPGNGQRVGLDLSTAIRGKIAKNEQKYPAAEFRGRYGAEDKGEGEGDTSPKRKQGRSRRLCFSITKSVVGKMLC